MPIKRRNALGGSPLGDVQIGSNKVRYCYFVGNVKPEKTEGETGGATLTAHNVGMVAERFESAPDD